MIGDYINAGSVMTSATECSLINTKHGTQIVVPNALLEKNNAHRSIENGQYEGHTPQKDHWVKLITDRYADHGLAKGFISYVAWLVSNTSFEGIGNSC